MIYFYYGEDKVKIYTKAAKLFESLRVKKPDASFLVLDADNFSISALEEVTASQGLFEKKAVVFVKNIVSDLDLEKQILKKIPEAAASENIFIWTEHGLLKAELDAFKKHAEKADVAGEEKKKKKEEFAIFTLADAFGRRDKKNLWTLFLKAREKAEPEAIHGILFWQIKAIALAQVAKTAGEADLNPFVFGKAKGFTKNYSPEEIKKISSHFVEIYHEAHRGKYELGIALEKFILSL